MSIDQNLKAFLDRFKWPEIRVGEFRGMDFNQTANRLRESFYRATRSVESDLPSMASVDTLAIRGGEGSVRARLYTPLGAGIGPGPGIVFFHGGGFVLGSLDSHDIVCRRLADGARARVLSVDYRLAPENRFPAAHDDALAAWEWVVENGEIVGFDPDRSAVCGDSAGGNLAAYVAQETNRRDVQGPAFQLLLYPLLQFADIRSKRMSFQEGGFFISPSLFDFFRDSYLGEEAHRMSPPVSPLFADEESFRGLPPAHIVLCGWDPLKDEGRVYADKLAHHGVPVTVREHPGMVHGFMNLTSLSVPARDAIREAGEVAGRALGSVTSEA